MVGDDVSDSSSNEQMAEYYPHISKWVCPIEVCCLATPYVPTVFVHNHASPDDFQPYSLKQAHTQLAQAFNNSPLRIAGQL